MKIAIHVHDLGPAGNIGGPVTTTTGVVDVPDSILPPNAKMYLDEVKRSEKYKTPCWMSVTFSLFVEETK